MVDVTEDQVLAALKSVQDPDLHRDIVTLGFVQNMRICDGAVAFTIQLTTPACPVKDLLKAQAQRAVADIPGVKSVQVEMTAQVRGRAASGEALVPQVRHIIAVASGKGGVGKSTVSVNLAVALAESGASVGLLDADIYGPSLPTMMGAHDKPLIKETPTGVKMVPLTCHGVLLISLGFLLSPDKAVVWRGPMVASAVRQLLGDVTWGALDYLIVDLPPGTGDASLTLAQQVPLSGVVLVMTPQKLAGEIASKAVAMFDVLSESGDRKIPILGVVENMSGGVFGHGGGAAAASEMNLPLLGTIPMDASVCNAGDSGIPAMLAAPASEAAQAFRALAAAVAARVSVLTYESEQGVPTTT